MSYIRKCNADKAYPMFGSAPASDGAHPEPGSPFPTAGSRSEADWSVVWMAFAAGSALFAGLTAVLAKVGTRTMPPNLATAIRTAVVLVFAWLVVFIVGSTPTIGCLRPHTWLFLVLSGLATGASWLCYFRALHLADVNLVTPIDKSSLVLTVLFAIVFLGETDHILRRLAGIALVGLGTWLMIERRARSAGESLPPAAPLAGNSYETPVARVNPKVSQRHGLMLGSVGHWLAWAVASAVFAASTSVLGKVGISDVEASLGTAIRTVVVLVMAWVVVLVTGELGGARRVRVPGREAVFLVLSGVATGASWLCFYRALQDGPASLVVPIDKLSVAVTVAFATLVLHEPLGRRAALGLVLIVAGTLIMLL